jgi:ATP-dependent RNA helicase RhlE
LAGFKSGDIRALVATDIAARGIDIDDLPHVVNYEIPNVCEDYVHRIGRTGRAGAQGEAVSLVSLDEEGFMMAIEKFTKQQIPVEMFQEFMPEPGEKAEPIAMGRQTIWGGAGKPPSREVMAAAAKAARNEMMDRIREKKGNEKPRKPVQGQQQRAQSNDRDEDDDSQPPRFDQPRQPNQGQQRHGQGQNRRRGSGGNGGNGGGNFSRQGQQSQGRNSNEGRRGGQGGGQGSGGGQGGQQRQPDPLRTGIDSLGQRGNRNRNNRGGSGGGGRQGGGGGGIDPLRTSYGRIK